MKFSVVLVTLGIALYAMSSADGFVDETPNGLLRQEAKFVPSGAGGDGAGIGSGASGDGAGAGSDGAGSGASGDGAGAVNPGTINKQPPQTAPPIEDVEALTNTQYIANGDDRFLSAAMFIGKGLRGGILMKKANDGEAIDAIINGDLRAQNTAELKVALNQVAEKLTSPTSSSSESSDPDTTTAENAVFEDDPVDMLFSGEGVAGGISVQRGTKGEFHVGISVKVNGQNMEEVKTRLQGLADQLMTNFPDIDEGSSVGSSTGTGSSTATGPPTGTPTVTPTVTPTGTPTGPPTVTPTGTPTSPPTGTGGEAGVGTDEFKVDPNGSGEGNDVTGSGSDTTSHTDPLADEAHAAPCESKTWGYTAETKNWNELFPECSGAQQSPIDIVTADVIASSTETIKFSGECAGFKLNWEHVHQYEWWAHESTCQVVTNKDDSPYMLKAFDIHTPSEHRFNGEKSDMEVHFVHEREINGKTEIMIIAALFNRIPTAHMISHDVQQVIKFMMQPRDEFDSRLYEKLLLSFDRFFHYTGSITIPPCTDGVQWYIVQDTFGIGSEELEALSMSMNEITLSNKGSNKRPLQPLNGRQVVMATGSA